MDGEDWAERQRKLAAAGLLVIGKEAQAKIESLSEVSPLIEAAQRSKVVLLNEQTVDEMLSLVAVLLLFRHSYLLLGIDHNRAIFSLENGFAHLAKILPAQKMLLLALEQIFLERNGIVHPWDDD